MEEKYHVVSLLLSLTFQQQFVENFSKGDKPFLTNREQKTVVQIAQENYTMNCYFINCISANQYWLENLTHRGFTRNPYK